MERKVSAIIKSLEKGQRRWVERGVFVYRERGSGRVRFGISYRALCSDGSKCRKRELIKDAESLSDARKALEAVHVDMRRGQRIINVATVPTCAEYFKRYLHDRASEKDYVVRARSAFNAAERVFGAVPIDELRPHQIVEFRRQRLETCEPATAHRDLAVLKRALKDAVKMYRYRDDNPATEVTIGKWQTPARRVLTVDEERRLLEVSPAHLRPFITTATNTGLRRGELCRLTWDAVDFQHGLLTIRQAKNRKVESVPMNATVRGVLLELYGSGRVGPVFLDAKGHPLVADTTSTTIVDAAKRAGIPDMTLHCLRHTFGSRLNDAGVDAFRMQKLMRHASITTTTGYVHVDGLDAAVEKLVGYGAVGGESGTQVATSHDAAPPETDGNVRPLKRLR